MKNLPTDHAAIKKILAAHPVRSILSAVKAAAKGILEVRAAALMSGKTIPKRLSARADMKKLAIICIGLTVCCLTLWGISRSQPGSYALQPEAQTTGPASGFVYAATNEPENPAPIPADDTPADSGTDESTALAPPLPEAMPADSVPQEAEPGTARPSLLAFSFDDGPSKEYTPQLLAGLKERGVHVTFFMLGVRAEKAPEIVLQAYEDGNVIGSHGYDHKSYLTKLSGDALRSQLQKTDDIISNITGDAPPFLLRPPYGAINEAVAKKTGKANILWNIDPRDWDVRDAEKVYTRIMEHAVDGGVIIMHDIYGSSVEGALKAIDALLAEGFQLVTIPELYEAYGIPLQAGGIYRSPQAYTLPQGS